MSLGMMPGGGSGDAENLLTNHTGSTTKLLWSMGVGVEADPQASLLPSQAPMVDSEQEKLLLSRTKQEP